jgi:hypothetical protein
MAPNRITAQSDEGASAVGGKSNPCGVCERSETTEPARGASSIEVSPMECRNDPGISKRSAEERSFPDPPRGVLCSVPAQRATAGQTWVNHRCKAATAPLLIEILCPDCREAWVAGNCLSASGPWPTGVGDGLSLNPPAPLATFPDSSLVRAISLVAFSAGFDVCRTSDDGGEGRVALACPPGVGILAGEVGGGAEGKVVDGGVGTEGTVVGGDDGGGAPAAPVTAESAELTTPSIASPVGEAEADGEEKKDAKMMLVAAMRHFCLRAVASDASAVLLRTMKDIHPFLCVAPQDLEFLLRSWTFIPNFGEVIQGRAVGSPLPAWGALQLSARLNR